MDPKDIKQGAAAVKKAEQLLKEVREANRQFLTKTEKLGNRMNSQMDKTEALWKKTEKNLKATEREAGKEVEAVVKDFFLGKDEEAKKAA